MTVQKLRGVERWGIIRRLGVTWQVQGFSTGCVELKCIYQNPPYSIYVMFEQGMWIKWIEGAGDD